MEEILRTARRKQRSTIEMIEEFVACESPSYDPAAVNRFVDLVGGRLKKMGTIRTHPGGGYGKHLRCSIDFGAPRKAKSILILGHSDTVWPVGTLRAMPVRRARGRLYGPGVFDMKAGIGLFLTAVEILRELDIPVRHNLVLQLNSDEEVGSESSRPLTEDAARCSGAVLVLEPAAGLDGKLKTARKGVGDYTVIVRGRAAHAGLDYAAGANAVVEMGRQLEKIAGFTRLDRGITVSPGVIHGGTRSNVVPDECRVEVDVRVPRMADTKYLDRMFRSLRPYDRRCSIEITGGVNRPPMERSAGARRLFRLAQSVARDMGSDLIETSVGGGSDGNFTAALGIPTLDGLGAIGEGAHAVNENIVMNRVAGRAALLAGLIAAI